MKSIILLLLILFSFSVYAESQESDLYNETIFNQAQQQILSMELDELDDFREYLSSCGTHSGGDIKRFFCERSTRAYVLKYGQGKPLEKLILAMAEVEFLIDLVDQADEKGQASEKMKMQVFKDLDRYIVIREMMESAIKQAYQKRLSRK